MKNLLNLLVVAAFRVAYNWVFAFSHTLDVPPRNATEFGTDRVHGTTHAQTAIESMDSRSCHAERGERAY